MKTIYQIAAARIGEYETKTPNSTRSDEPLDVRLARALLEEHLQLTATASLLADKQEEFDQLDEQCLAFIGEMMRQDRVIKVIEPIGWQAIQQRNAALDRALEGAHPVIERLRKIQKDFDDLALHLVSKAFDRGCLVSGQAIPLEKIIDRMSDKILELEHDIRRTVQENVR